VTRKENELLKSCFCKEEFRKVVFESYPDSASGLMACLLCFIKKMGGG
jgi:hypothetical protein